MADVFKDVYWFNLLAGNNGGSGGIPNVPMLRQAIEHMGEELDEMLSASQGFETRMMTGESLNEVVGTVEGIADAALDMIYVSVNVLYALGLRRPDILWREVHNANMRKLPDCPDCSGRSLEDQGICRTCDSTRKLPPKRRADGKILKPDGWIPPSLKKHLIKELCSPIDTVRK